MNMINGGLLSRATRMFPSERHVGSSTLECFSTPHLPLTLLRRSGVILAARRHSELLPYLGKKTAFQPVHDASLPVCAIGLVDC
jgi:hypothetical protein